LCVGGRWQVKNVKWMRDFDGSRGDAPNTHIEMDTKVQNADAQK